MSEVITLNEYQSMHFMTYSYFLDIENFHGRFDPDCLRVALSDLYTKIGRTPPKLLVFDSPAACATVILERSTARALPQEKVEHESSEGELQFGRSLRHQLWHQFWLPLVGQITDQLGEKIWDASAYPKDPKIRDDGGVYQWQWRTRDIFETDSWREDRLIDSWREDRLIIDRRMKLVADELENQLDDQNLLDARFSFGTQDLCWISFGSFANWVGVELESETLDNLKIIDRVRRCNWWYPFEDVVVASQPPLAVHWDQHLRMHCEDGPAIEFADGFKLFSWHGCGVPSHWIMDRKNLDPIEVIQQENVAMRAAGVAIAGWSKMLSVLDCRVIDDSGNDDIGQLIELILPGISEPGRFLKAVCPRNGTIVEGVPYVSDIDSLPIETAIAAQAWRIGEAQSEYQHPPHRT